MVYNEAFARAGMFLAFLSATLVVLGLISAIAGFGDSLLMIAAVVLALDLFIGLASLARIQAASEEDIRYLQGMNRLRHATSRWFPTSSATSSRAATRSRRYSTSSSIGTDLAAVSVTGQ